MPAKSQPPPPPNIINTRKLARSPTSSTAATTTTAAVTASSSSSSPTHHDHATSPPPTSAKAPAYSTRSNSTDRHERRKYMKIYFSTSDEWIFDLFRQHCHDNTNFMWTDGNIRQFWLDNLREIKRSTTSTDGQKYRASLILAAEDKQKRKQQRQQISSFVFNGSVSDIGHIGVATTASPPLTTNTDYNNNAPPQDDAIPIPAPIVPNSWPHTIKPQDDFFFPDGTTIDQLRLSSRGTNTYFSTLLQTLRILDLDEFSKSHPHHRRSLDTRVPSLPQVSNVVEYTLGRFIGVPADMDSLIAITESSPRKPNERSTPQNYEATYLNRAISHWLTLVQKFRSTHYLWSSLKEGFLDVIWGFTLDDLWLGGTLSRLFIARKELLCHIPGINHRFDGLFRYQDDSMVFDVGVAESSITPSNVNNDSKGTGDLSKVVGVMKGFLGGLAERVGWEWEVMRKLMVFGVITSGWTITIHRMFFVTQATTTEGGAGGEYYCAVKRSETLVVRLDLDSREEFFDLLRLLTRVKAAMENTVESVLRHSRKKSF